MKKPEDALIHSKRRLRERYNLNAPEGFMDGITEKILLGHVIKSTPLGNGSRKVDMKFCGRRFLLVFNPHRLQVMTFLPPPNRFRTKKAKTFKDKKWGKKRLENNKKLHKRKQNNKKQQLALK